MRIALISKSSVQNIIEAELSFAQTLGFETVVEANDDTYLGQVYINDTFVPEPPEPVAQPVTTPIMTKLTFLRRFTQTERLTIRAAKVSDPIIEDVVELMQLAEEIGVTDFDTVQYVGYLAQKGFITNSRIDEILAPVVL